jgi:pilus assembly protein CpaB
MRRLGLIVLAVAVVIGIAAIWGLVNLQRARATANNATVVVAARGINLGQTLTPDMLRLQAWPANAIPEGAFTSVADVAGAEPRVALRALEANEPILATRVSGAGGRATLSATIAPGHRAVAIRVNDVVGVAGFVLPGDYVDVLLTRNEEQQSYRNEDMRTDLLIANVRVLAIDQTANESENNPQVARAVTIEVTPEDGQKVALAGQIGTLSLSLRRADEIGEGATTTPQDTIRIQDLRAEAAAHAQPIAVRTAAPAPRPRASAPRRSGASIEVVRGFTSNNTPVATE